MISPTLEDVKELRKMVEELDLKLDHHSVGKLFDDLTVLIDNYDRLKKVLVYGMGDGILTMSTLIGPFLKGLSSDLAEKAVEE